MAGGGGGSNSPAVGFSARLKTDLAGVSSTLTLLPYQGNRVLINRKSVTIPPTGLTVLVTANLINGSGADAGAAGVASTLYYVYVSNDRASFSPSSIRLSSVAPTLVDGVKYLATSGNGLNWRFVGWVRLNATPQFESSDTNALIVNYYNRLQKSVFANPGYVNDNARTTYIANGNWAKANGGTGSAVGVISNGEDACQMTVIGIADTDNNALVSFGAGVDGTPPTRCGIQYIGQVSAQAAVDSETLAEGYHTVDLYVATQPAANETVVADFARNGAAADPRGSLVQVDLLV
jgi:hypothetical protein